MEDILAAIRTLLELGWPAIVLLFLVTVENDRRRRIDEHIRDLRAIVFQQHPDLEDWQPPTGAILPARREGYGPLRKPAHGPDGEARVTADYNLNLLSLFHWRGPHESAA